MLHSFEPVRENEMNNLVSNMPLLVLLASNLVFFTPAKTSSQDKTIYAITNFGGDRLRVIDTANVTDMVIGHTDPFERIGCLAINSSGELYAVTSPFTGAAQLVQLDPKTGIVVRNVELAIDRVFGLAFSTDDTLYSVNDQAFETGTRSALRTIAVDTGETTLVGDTGIFCLHTIVFGNDGVLYTWDGDNGSGNSMGLYRIDTSTGVATDVNPGQDAQQLNVLGMALGPDGVIYLSSNLSGGSGQLYVVDTATGDVELVNDNTLASPFGMAGVAPVLLGDVNCDNAINLLDVGPFIDALNNNRFEDKADINSDGSVNLLDVAPFVNLLAG